MKSPSPYLSDLARFLPLMTGEQMCRWYYAGDHKEMLRDLRKDAAREMISFSTELIRERTESDGAIVSIKSGQANRNPHQIAYLAAQRWSDRVTPKLIIRGTVKLASIFGGEVHTVAKATVSHECALADVFFSKRMTNPEFEWDLVRVRPGNGALPDAVTTTGMIEVIGRYNGNAVAGKLSLAATANLELW